MKLHLMHSEMLIVFLFFPLLKLSWNCGNQTPCVKTKQGAAELPAFPSTRVGVPVAPGQCVPGRERCNSYQHP